VNLQVRGGGAAMSPARLARALAKSYDERYRAGQNPESFDKDNVRRFLLERGYTGDGPVPAVPDDVRITASERYLEAVETIIGQPFEPNLEPALPRLRKNLGLSH